MTRGARGAPREPVVLVFVRAPVRGAVKTRLAAELGDDAALAVYRRLAAHTLHAARGSGAAVRVHYTPAADGASTRAWLGGGGIEYRPQAEGGLGERLAAAFDEAFADGFGRVAVVGSDLPALTAGLLRHALAMLARADAVLGPARDGGYYLLGLRRPRPSLFGDLAWSGATVFSETRRRLREAGIEPRLLPRLADVDHAADLPARGGWAAYARASAYGSAPA